MMATPRTRKFAFTVTGTASNWCHPDHLKEVIEAILKEEMPPEDVADLKVKVAEELE